MEGWRKREEMRRKIKKGKEENGRIKMTGKVLQL